MMRCREILRLDDLAAGCVLHAGHLVPPDAEPHVWDRCLVDRCGARALPCRTHGLPDGLSECPSCGEDGDWNADGSEWICGACGVGVLRDDIERAQGAIDERGDR